jgi:glutamate--cysteine ligase
VVGLRPHEVTSRSERPARPPSRFGCTARDGTVAPPFHSISLHGFEPPRAAPAGARVHVTSQAQGLDHDVLREVLASELFDWGPVGSEGFALRLDALAVTPAPERAASTPFGKRIARPPLPVDPQLLHAALQQAAAQIGVPFEPRALWEGSACDGARIDLGPGDQVRVHSDWCATPARADETAARAHDALRAVLAPHNVFLIALGHEPWHDAAARPGSDASPWGVCQERVFASVGTTGGPALRCTAGGILQVAYGGPQRGPRRWRAAWLLAPLFEAIFAHSPLEQGASARVKSARARAWRHAEASRCGFPRDVLESPSMSPIDQYLEFALAARVLWVLRDGQAFALTRPFTFGNWLTHGWEGVRPGLDDWRCHLATLRPLVRPAGSIVMECGDAQARPFGGVPLALAAALLCDDNALEGLATRLSGRRAEGAARLETGLREGLLDPTLAEDARELFALASDALDRAPAGWISRSQALAFAAFHQRFVRRSRTPADDLLDVFLDQGALTLGDIEALEEAWCGATETPITWCASRFSA